ncbi:MAG: Npt1/Npt2 family nucleotide transporter [bacterium]
MIANMIRFFKSIIDVRRGELTLTLLMFFYYYLLLVTYYFLKPARDSLFLVRLGADQLPFVFILIALIVVPVTTAYSRASGTLKLNKLINATTLILIVNLFIMRWLLGYKEAWIFYLFYVWVSIYGVLSTSQFWLLANAVFDAAQAKRVFVLFGLGGIIGAFTGGEVTSFIVRVFNVSTENLLFFCMALSFVDFQFKTVAVDAFPAEKDLTSFLGLFYGRLSLISFLFQLLLSYRVLRVLGVGGVILFLPLGLLGGSVMMLAYPGLIAGIIVRGADGVFRYSIDKTGRELLFLPVPLEVKKRTKVFIDMFIDRWFRGFAGLMLLLLVTVLGLSVRHLSIVVLVMLAIWIVMVLLIRKEYVNAFRQALDRRTIDPGELRINIAEPSTLKTLRAALAGGGDRSIAYALDLLNGQKDASLVESVRPLLRHSTPEIRRQAVKLLQIQDGDFAADIKPLLSDSDPHVQREAMYYVCTHSDADPVGKLETFLADPDPRIRAVALNCAVEYGGDRARDLADVSTVRALISSTGEHAETARLEVAKSLGKLNDPAFRGDLLGLMDDPSPSVASEAITAAGRTGDREFIPRLLQKLSEKRYRTAAAEALATYGDRIIGTLIDYVIDPTVPGPIRSRICRVLSQIPSQLSVDALAHALGKVESEMRFHVIKALNALRSRHPDLKFGHESLDAALLDETVSYYTILQILEVYGRPDTPGERLLVRALTEKIDQNLERIFRLLGLRYPPKDMYSAYLGIVSTQREFRASAIEFLDNVLKKDTKRYLLPIMDDIDQGTKVKKGRELFGITLKDVDESLEFLIKGKDPWLRACAIYSLSGNSPPALRRLVEQCERDPNPVVRETAALVARTGSA